MSEVITVDVVIFKINKKSQRGFYFKESTVDKFLDSDKCKERLNDRTALSIITHRERRKGIEDEAALDTPFINRSYVAYISRLYKHKGYFMAELTLLDPELFEGETKEKIKFIAGLIKSGVNLTTSAGIRAFYNNITKEGEIIYDIVGIDFTMQPDFEESKISRK